MEVALCFQKMSSDLFAYCGLGNWPGPCFRRNGRVGMRDLDGWFHIQPTLVCSGHSLSNGCPIPRGSLQARLVHASEPIPNFLVYHFCSCLLFFLFFSLAFRFVFYVVMSMPRHDSVEAGSPPARSAYRATHRSLPGLILESFLTLASVT